MPPPSVIGVVIRPFVMIEAEIVMIRTVLGNVRALFITLLVLVNSFFIKPLIEGSAMIEHAVQNNPDTSSVRFFDKLCKQFVGSLQIRLVCHAVDIFGRKAVFSLIIA